MVAKADQFQGYLSPMLGGKGLKMILMMTQMMFWRTMWKGRSNKLKYYDTFTDGPAHASLT